METIIGSIIMIVIGIAQFRDRYNPVGMYFLNDRTTVGMKVIVSFIFIGIGISLLLGG